MCTHLLINMHIRESLIGGVDSVHPLQQSLHFLDSHCAWKLLSQLFLLWVVWTLDCHSCGFSQCLWLFTHTKTLSYHFYQSVCP